ncbi:hypothetical protein BgiBS90_030962 [Biomphalaria glabrata]|nr:hypothetical protein BgiBS90_030962 [Biomphalaria glabrata]
MCPRHTGVVCDTALRHDGAGWVVNGGRPGEGLCARRQWRYRRVDLVTSVSVAGGIETCFRSYQICEEHGLSL